MTNKQVRQSRKKSAASVTQESTSPVAVLDRIPEVCQDVPMSDSNASVINEVILPSSNDSNVDVPKIQKIRRNKIMSKTQESAAPTAIEIKKNIKVFNLKTFAEEKIPVTASFTPAGKYEDAISRVQALPNSESLVLEAINSILEKAAFNAEKAKALGGDMVSKKTVLEFINPFRMTPPYSSVVTTEKGHKDWKPQYNKQTADLVKDVASNPFMLNAIRAAAAASTADDSDDTEETE